MVSAIGPRTNSPYFPILEMTSDQFVNTCNLERGVGLSERRPSTSEGEKERAGPETWIFLEGEVVHGFVLRFGVS